MFLLLRTLTSGLRWATEGSRGEGGGGGGRVPAAARRSWTDPAVLIFPGRILRQVPVPYQRPGRTKDRQPRPATPAPDQHPPGYASIKIQTCCCQVSADQHGARYPNQAHGGRTGGYASQASDPEGQQSNKSHLSPQPSVCRGGFGAWGWGTAFQNGRRESRWSRPSQAVKRSCVHRWLWGRGRRVHPHQDILPSHPCLDPSQTPGPLLPVPGEQLQPQRLLGATQVLLRLGLMGTGHQSSGLVVGQGCLLSAGSDAGDPLEYNPNLLDDPQWPCGKHKRVLIFASYMVRRAPSSTAPQALGGGL